MNDIVVNLENYDVISVIPPKPTESTLKAIEQFEKTFDFSKFHNQETKKVKLKVSYKNIIAKIYQKKQEIKQELELIYSDFLDLNVLETLSLAKLEALYNFIKQTINNSFIVKKDLYIYNAKEQDFRIFDKEMFLAQTDNIINTYKLYKVETKPKKNGDVDVIKIPVLDKKSFYNYIKLNAPVIGIINASINPFAKQTKFYIDRENKEVILVKNKIALNKPNYNVLNLIGKEEKQEILEDYFKLWEGGEKLQEVLDFIVFGRFMSARKELQLNINAPSSWGKGFFMGVMEDLGIGITIKQTDFKNDRPSGLNVKKLLNSLCLLVDEFKKYNNYLFQINNYMETEEKFGSRYRIPVYSRLFFNAQKSESLVGYINEQITNRIILMEIKTDYLLINSPVYSRNKLIYKEVIKEHIYNYFVKKIQEIVKMGEIKAEEISDKRVWEIINKYKIKAKSTNDLIVDTVVEFLEDYLKFEELKENNKQDTIFKMFSKREIELMERFIFYNQNSQKFVILKHEDTILSILRERLAERDFKKVEYSKAELLDIFANYLKADYKVVYVTELKTNKRGLVIKQTELFKYKTQNIEEDSTRKDININNSNTNTTEINELDILNANLSYSSNVLKNYGDLNNIKNKFLLLTSLNSITTIKNTATELLEIYNTNNVKEAIRYYIKDKAQLLKQLHIYKREDYFIN